MGALSCPKGGLAAGKSMNKLIKVLSQKSNGVDIASVYVFGERNSGTNYISNLISRNCRAAGSMAGLHDPANKERFGWKHGFPSMLGVPDDVLAIAVHREPIAWLHSINRTPWHTPSHLRGLPFSQFIRSEWQSIIDDTGFGIGPGHPLWMHELLADRDPVTGKRFANVLHLRNAKNRGFASLDHRFGNVLRVNYETVLADPQKFLNALCNTYGMVRLRTFDPVIHDRGASSRGVFQPKPVPLVAQADKEYICAHLDLCLEVSLGYHLDCVDTGPDAGNCHLRAA